MVLHRYLRTPNSMNLFSLVYPAISDAHHPDNGGELLDRLFRNYRNLANIFWGLHPIIRDITEIESWYLHE
jgi:hypothetical protein